MKTLKELAAWAAEQLDTWHDAFPAETVQRDHDNLKLLRKALEEQASVTCPHIRAHGTTHWCELAKNSAELRVAYDAGYQAGHGHGVRQERDGCARLADQWSRSEEDLAAHIAHDIRNRGLT